MGPSARVLCVVLVLITLGSCSPVPWVQGRPDPESVSGPAPYVETCAGCHGDRAGRPYATSLHAAKGIRCGQCHQAGNHPDFTQPVRDGKCGGCHQPEFQQTLTSRHFATRTRQALDGDRLARVALRRDGFVAGAPGDRTFVGDATAGELGGRLCAACHYDEHRLGLGAVQQTSFCTGCHANRETHFPMSVTLNRCVICHVRVGESVTGQVVNTHRFARPGAGSPAQ